MIQALTVVSLTVEEEVPIGKTRLHLLVHLGDGAQFRLRTDTGQPFLLEDFGGRSLEVVRAFFAPGRIICTHVKRVPQKFWADTDHEQRTDRALGSTRIVAPAPPRAREPSVGIAVQQSGILYGGADGRMAERPAEAAQYRATG